MKAQQARGSLFTRHYDKLALIVVLLVLLVSAGLLVVRVGVAQLRLTEKPPSARRVRPEISDPLDSLLLRMMATAKEDRPADYDELMAELESVLRVVRTRGQSAAQSGTAPRSNRLA